MTTSNFFQDVYDVVRLIPEGRLTSYGAIAKFLGRPRNARMVGWAMHDSSRQEGIPAHRVVNSKGELSGKSHFGGDHMSQLLEAEGVLIKANRIVNFKEVFWDPEESIDL